MVCTKEIKVVITEVDVSELTEEELQILNCLCSCTEDDDDDQCENGNEQ